MTGNLNQPKMERFTTINGDHHLIDNAGNHFVNNKCVNPLISVTIEPNYIGSTHPKRDLRISGEVQITGSVPYLLDENGRFVRL